MAGRGFGMEETHFIVVGIADGGHTLALGWAGAVEFNVDAQRFTSIGQLDHAGDAIIAHIAAYIVGGVGNGKVDVRFQRAHMFGL